MENTLKDAIAEFAEIAKACPENLQERCFSLLLEDFLTTRRTKKQLKQDPGVGAVIKAPIGADSAKVEQINNPATNQEDFADSDLHVKARKFLKDSELTIEHINEIFYKEGDSIEPLYEDLRTTKMAESQIRVALLHALRNGMATGDFEFNGEAVREEVQSRKCYDPTNFTAHFKNNKGLFENFDKYDKKSPVVRLSKDGRTALAGLIKELQ